VAKSPKSQLPAKDTTTGKGSTGQVPGTKKKGKKKGKGK
jgi:hypothetical protein